MSLTRVRAFVVFGVLMIAALVTVIVAVVRDTQNEPLADACKGAVMVNATLPRGTNDITVRVFNGTKEPGLAAALTNDLKNRGFQTEKPGESTKRIKDVAIFRYGPKALSSAWLLRAFFLNQATPEFDPKRTSATVDVIVGAGYQQLATPTEVNQSLAALGDPELPPGACAEPQKPVQAAQ
ncbi:LytR C-terminal domain-containing protein [Actinoplanes sp. TFC3]|uniref:LytR C-terminal domain-containing protein n=1 Tax=Actinoplanes sp. TFC3 TaxID=1710355 RepID=UPI0008313596|nr:LytR C-terminal domain-containing protein [Actinoplanes sp. TFC3]